MDVTIGIIVFFFAVIGLEEVRKTDAELTQVNERIEQLESDFLRLTGSHAAVSARDKVNHDSQEARIKLLELK